MRPNQINTRNNRKRIQPIKSPSPDLSNSNIISHTTAPLDQIQRYKTTMSPLRTSPLHSSNIYLQTDKLKAENHALKLQIAHLIQQNQEYQPLFDQNQRLVSQINRLQKQIQKLRSKQVRSLENLDEQTINEFKDHIQQLSQENKRLGIKLQKQQSKIVYYERENNIYKKQVQFFKQQCQGSYPSNQNSRNKNNQIEEICRSYQNAVDGRFNDFQSVIYRKLKQFQNRLEAINIKQKMVDEKIDRHKNSQNKNPLSHRVSISTQFMSNRKQIPYDSKYASPVRQLNSRQQSTQKQQYQQLKNNYKKCYQELQQYRKHAIQCEGKIYKTKLQEKQQPIYNRPNIIKKVSQSQQQLLRDKVKYLQSELEHKVTLLSSIQQQSNQTHNQLLERLKRYEIKIDNFQQQRNESQQKLKKEQQKLRVQQQKYQHLLQQYNSYKSIKQVSKTQSVEFNRLKNQNNQLQQHVHQLQLSNEEYVKLYIQMLNQSRSILTSQNIHNIYEDIDRIQNQSINLQMLKNQHTQLIQQLRNKILAFEQQIIQLQTRNKIVSLQNGQLTEQLNRLKQTIRGYTNPKNRNQLKMTFSMHSENVSCRMKELVGTAVKCMDNIEDKIKQSLRQ